ncbi:MAG: TonB-dependent receptor [Muribaculaceae bacterium]|nr:TonB-dependent receptor [Muribaculaceae bacterium]
MTATSIWRLSVCSLVSMWILNPRRSNAENFALVDSVIHLNELEVSANKHPIATVQKLSGKELQSFSATSIADALKYFAGVQIKDFGGLGGLKTINVRSLGAQHVGVYVDGIRITNAQNGTVDLGKFSLSTLESVSLYNANKLDVCQSASEYASGATVYLRTKKPLRDSLSVMARYASFHTYSGRINAQINRNGWAAFIDGEYVNSSADYKFRYKSEYEDTIGIRRNSDIEYGRIEGALYKKGFSSHIYCYLSERGCPGGIVRRLSDKYTNVGREWDKDCFIQASYNGRFGKKTQFKANAKYSFEYLRYCTDYPDNQNTAKVNNHYRQHDAYIAFSTAYTLNSILSVNLGYDVRTSWLYADIKKFQPIRRLDEKGVVAVNTTFHSVRAVGSLLYQHYKDYTTLEVGAAHPLNRFTPSVSLSYSLRNFTFKGWYKNIFRVPTLNDLYYTQAGNRNLKPEYTKQLDLGVEYFLNVAHWHASMQVDIYQNRIENRIVCLPLKGTYTWSMMNYGETFCRGLNANLSCRYSIGLLNLSVLGSFTWQRDLNRTDSNDTDTYNMPICYSPAISFGITGIVAWKNYSITISDLHVGKRIWSYADPDDILKPYNNVDAKLSADIGKFVASFEINDLFDVQYEHIPRYPMPGRNFRLSLTFSI